MPIIKRLLPMIISGGIFALVFSQLEPPKSLETASYLQIAAFFPSLFFSLLFFLNLFFQFWVRSLITSMGIILLLIIKALGIFNPLLIILIILSTILLTKTFKKPRRKFYQSRIPRISKLAKQR